MEFSWPMVGAISTIITVVGIVALLWLRAQLSKDFTPNEAFRALSEQVRKMEHDLRSVPTHRDIQEHSERVRAVELGVAVMQESVASMKESMIRIDSGVRRIEQHLLETNK